MTAMEPSRAFGNGHKRVRRKFLYQLTLYLDAKIPVATGIFLKGKAFLVSYPDPDSLRKHYRTIMYNATQGGGGGGGGGQKTKWKTPSSNFEELIESITNKLLFFAGGSRKKVMRCQSFGGVGGGGLCLK